MKDLMLDVETLSASSNAIVTQVGMVEFDITTGEVGKELLFNLDLQESIDKGFEISASTLQWWLEQNHDVLCGTLIKNELSNEELLRKASNMFRHKRIWCHATFDVPKVMAYYNKYKLNSNIYYKGVRDIRTLIDLSEFDLDSLDWSNKTHNALDDCKFQVNYCHLAYKKLVDNQIKIK